MFSRKPPPDPVALAAARTAELEADVARQRALADLGREQAAADRAAARQATQDAEAERTRRRDLATARRRQRYARLVVVLGTLRTVAPLLTVNTATVGGQFVYAYSETPETWPAAVRVACAVVYALAAETIALYVGWHAHDALLQGAHATAARLRRASYLIAACFGLLNYSHFSDGWEPTAFAVALGVLSLLSPWLWGLHTRRAQNVRLLAEGLIDEGGAEFSAERKRAFPVRSRMARRWSIDHNVRDPRAAWEGYNRERAQRRVERQRRLAHRPAGRFRAAVTVLRGQEVPGTPAAIAAVPIDPDLKVLCAEVRGQARDARSVSRTGAYAFYRHPERRPDRQIGSNSDGQNGRQNLVSDGDLEAFVRMVSEPTPPALPAPANPHSGRQNSPDRPVKKATSEQASGPGRPPKQVAKAARVAAKMPGAKAPVIARKAGVSEATARRAITQTKES